MSPELCPEKLARWCGGQWVRGIPPRIRGVSKDSRSLEAENLYFALQGARFDGHEYVGQVLAQGASGAVVARSWWESPAGRAVGMAQGTGCLLIVDDPAKALRDAARGYRRDVALTVVGVTGSAGKSSVKELTAQILSAALPTACTRGNWNNAVGLPLSLLQMEPTAKVGVFEVGTNHPGEIADLCSILEPDWGIVTNAGAAHLEGLASVAGVVAEKSDLLRALPPGGLAVLNSEEPNFESFRRAAAGRRILTIAADSSADYRCLRRDPVRQEFTLLEAATGEEATLRLSSPGLHNVQNALMAVAVARAMGLSWPVIIEAARLHEPLPMRWEDRRIGRLRVINDAYNANALSMRASISAFAELPAPGKWLVLAGMMELGPSEEAQHKDLGRFLAAWPWTGLLVVGPHGNWIAEGAVEAGLDSGRILRCATRDAAADRLLNVASDGDAVLLKGSRSTGLEKLAGILEDHFGRN